MEGKTGRQLAAVVVVSFFIVFACSSYKSDKHFKKGVEYQQNGEYSRALEEYSSSLQFKPDRIDARLAKASLYEEQRIWEKAIAEYKEILSANPDGQPRKPAAGPPALLRKGYGPGRQRQHRQYRN